MAIEKNQVLPDANAIAKIMEIASSNAEGAQYFVDRYKQILEPKAPSSVLSQLNEWLNLVIASVTESNDKWNGKYTEQTAFTKLHMNLSEAAFSKQSDLLGKNIQLDIAISYQAEILRGYVADGQPLNNDELGSMDKLFNVWLAEQNVIIQDGTLYQTNEKGDMKRDSSNNLLKVDAEKIKENLPDFKSFVENKGMHLEIVQHQYAQPSQTINNG